MQFLKYIGVVRWAVGEGKEYGCLNSEGDFAMLGGVDPGGWEWEYFLKHAMSMASDHTKVYRESE